MIHKIHLDQKEILIVGTAHVSQASIDEVKATLEEIRPDAIAIELDEERYQSMTQAKKWEDTDIVSIIKQKKTGFLLAQMILSSYQRKIANQFQLKAGDEMNTAIQFAQQENIRLLKIDRSIQVTLMRVWRSLNFWAKMNLLSEGILSFFEPNVEVKDIEALKESDLLASALDQISHQFPQIAETLIFERDRVMAERLRRAQGSVIVAVVGAAHVPGILKAIETPQQIDELLKIPPKSKSSNLTQWIVPLLLLGLILVTMLQSPNMAIDTLLRFILINGSLAALGTALALGHPLSILTAFLMAPLGALSPFLATGWFAGLMEAWIHKPKVDDFIKLQEDILHVKGYWTNRVARILLVVLFANLFASIGTIVYSFDLIKNLFN